MSLELTTTFEIESAPQAAAATPTKRKSIVRILLKDAAVIMIGLMATELLMQLIVPEYGHDYYDRYLTASHPVAFNADGYRGPAVTKTKLPGETRILALGDSTTFGTGVSAEDTWPLQLQDMLSSQTHHPATAMNVALQGATMADLTYAYEHRWAEYQPDTVVALVSSNMISFAWMQRNNTPQMPAYVFSDHSGEGRLEKLKTEATHAYGRLCLPHFLSVNMQRGLYWAGVLDHRIADPTHPYGALLAHGWMQQDLPKAEVDEAWAVFAQQLAALHKTTQEHGANLVVAFSPCRFDMSDSVFDDEKNLPKSRLSVQPSDRFAQICRDQGITCVDTLVALRAGRAQLTQERGHTASMYIMFDYNHLDRDGHQALAAALLPEIREATGTLPVASTR